MNKNRYIRQYDFNDNPNGYYGWSDGDYDTYLNMGRVGLDYWHVPKLIYLIR